MEGKAANPGDKSRFSKIFKGKERVFCAQDAVRWGRGSKMKG
jgi:hypothetical protein